ncbi:hypothetical protein RUM43_004828 [Polyplax serrata]|uniref:Uncharacterized protein n=1 Tax=Polyplax serrata TaxID=468196 RepID=A0AAN8SB90_POLSC
MEPERGKEAGKDGKTRLREENQRRETCKKWGTNIKLKGFNTAEGSTLDEEHGAWWYPTLARLGRPRETWWQEEEEEEEVVVDTRD